MSGMTKKKLLLLLFEKTEHLYVHYEGLNHNEEEPQTRIKEIFDIVCNELKAIEKH